MSKSGTAILVVYWEWTEGKHKGARFWAAHSTECDGRLSDWPNNGLRALGAARVTVVEGDGLDLLPHASAETPSDAQSLVVVTADGDVRVEIERDKTGVLFATSPDLPGLFVAEQDMAMLLAKIPANINLLFGCLTQGQDI